MIAKGNKRRLQEFQIKEAIDQQFKQFRQQNDLIQSQLDERIDEINARFSDLKNAAEFDANRLDKKLAAIRVNTQEAPCLGPRTSITLCLSEKGPAECDDFIKALEKCVTEAVVFQK
jgi:vacuolar-type H+-ATPase subunit I/STV1